MISKKRKLANAKVDANKAYTLSEASTLVKEEIGRASCRERV